MPVLLRPINCEPAFLRWDAFSVKGFQMRVNQIQTVMSFVPELIQQEVRALAAPKGSASDRRL
ncbi:MAG TPA: hypothetical protein VK934_03360 [Fimbriimonas sp.]|nr:hypothetical protein [Fimbriimonas sp.]